MVYSRHTNDHKEIKKILADQRKEYQRYIGVALESVEDRIKLVAESLEEMQEQFREFRQIWYALHQSNADRVYRSCA